MPEFGVQSHYAKVGGTESAMQRSLAYQSQLFRVGGNESAMQKLRYRSAMQSWRYRVSYQSWCGTESIPCNLASRVTMQSWLVQSQLCRVGVQSQLCVWWYRSAMPSWEYRVSYAASGYRVTMAEVRYRVAMGRVGGTEAAIRFGDTNSYAELAVRVTTMQELAVQSPANAEWRYKSHHAELGGAASLCSVVAELAVPESLCRVGAQSQSHARVGGTESAMQSWRYRVSYAELAVQNQPCRVGGTESAMQSWRYRVSYAELAVQSQLCRVGGTESAMQVGGRSARRVCGTESTFKSWRYESLAELAVTESAMQMADESLCRVGGTESAMQSWRYRVSYAELAVQSQLCRVGGTESAMQSWRYRVSYAELAVQSQLCRVGGTESASNFRTSQLCRLAVNSRDAELAYKIAAMQFGVQSPPCQVAAQSQPAELAVHRVSYAELAGTNHLCRVGWYRNRHAEVGGRVSAIQLAYESACRVGAQSAMQSWRYRVSYAELAVQN
eukprot:gene20500-27291_t